MAFNSNPDELYLGRGAVLFDRFDVSGNTTGFRYVGDVSKLEVTPSVTLKEAYDHTRAAANKIASIPTQQKHTISLDLMEGFNPDNLAVAILGDTAVLTSGLQIVQQETLSAACSIGRIYQTLNRNIEQYVLSSGATALVEGVDFLVQNAAMGLIQLLGGGALVSGSPVSCNYQSAGVNAVQVRGGTTANIKGRLLFIGDPASGPVLDLIVRKVQFTPSAAIALITDDFATLSLSGECLADNNFPDSPIYTYTRTGIVSGSL